MTKLSLKLFLPIFLLAALFITSCSDEESSISDVEVENYTEDAVFQMQKHAMCGVRGCFEFMFPITIIFPDGGEAEVESYEEMKDRIKRWKYANPDALAKPNLQYPLDLLTSDGEIVTAESREDLRNLVKECVRDFINNHPRLNNSCFRIAFPINIELPRGDTITVENRIEFKKFLRRWHATNPNVVGKPKIAFPVTVILKEDGTEVVLESKEDLQALKEECQG
jgi:hypothetical protein